MNLNHMWKAFFVSISMGGGMAWAQGDGATDNVAIPTTANTLLPRECAEHGWRLLHRTGNRNTFDSNFTQWISGNNTNTALPTSWGYRAEDQTIYAQGGTPDLRSEFQAAEFDLRMTYRNSGNDAIFYKMLTRGSFAWSVGVEFAIENNVNFTPKQSAGSVFDIWAPNPPASQIYNSYSGGKWNQARIVVKKRQVGGQTVDSVEHWLNNRRVGRYQFWDQTFRSARANSKWANSNDFAQNTSGCQCTVTNGFVGFQGDHDGTWHIRDFRINTNPQYITTGTVGAQGGNNPCPGTSVEKGKEKLSYSLERLPGAIRLNLRDAKATHAELLAVDGKTAGQAALERDGSAVLIRNWKQTGVYFLRVAAGKTTYREKIFLP